MNDVAAANPAAAPRGVRARDAASLILLRGDGRDLELLVGRRPMHVRFMPGVYVFPGGAVDVDDRYAWHVEVGVHTLPPRLVRCARAALRETWEEAGVLFGRRAGRPPVPRPTVPVAAAYAAAGAVAAVDRLRYVGRAITPARVFRRFNTRFFLGDGADVIGEPHASDELEDVRWHPIGREPLEPLRDVSQFMLARAIALRGGDLSPPPLFYTVGGTRRIGLCREAAMAVSPP
ncbi:MAG: NUDIX domain-containing protein [Alphaproteobacteria bacterium]|nr:NUDIX domain-containing protein [Alphaproteobacteria bacterium]